MSEARRELIARFVAVPEKTDRFFATAEKAYLDSQDFTGHRRVSRWIETVNELDEFVGRAGRLPRENRRLTPGQIGALERSLAAWVRYQRTPAARELLCAYQVERLELVPGFRWDPLGESQREHERAYAAFLAEHRRAPRYRAADNHERRLADWAAKRRARARSGRLTDEEVWRLREAGVPIPRRRG